jgi:hypothetical protein
MRWRIATYTWNNPSTKRELRAAVSRSLQLNLDTPSTFSFSVSGDNPHAAFITELVSDITINLNGTDLTRMRVWNGTDNCQETGYSVSFNCNDYRAVLQRRKVRDTDALIFNSMDQAFIAMSMINAVQGRVNGSYGITPGVGSTTGVLVNNALKEGQFVGKEIDSMANKDIGFDWDIGPDMKFNIYYPKRGGTFGKQIEYGKSMSTFTRSRNPANFANDVVGTGGNATLPVQRESATVTTDAEGRWDATVSFPDVSEPTTLTAKTNDALDTLKTIPITYSAELAPGFWQGPNHIGLGDMVRIRAKRGRLNDDITLRVYGIGISIDDDGAAGLDTDPGETVRLTLR